jgi:hypothetical protein
MRSRSIGVRKAVEDDRVRRLVEDATIHLSTAFRPQPKPKRRRLRKLAAAGVVLGSALIVMRARSGSS